MSVHDVEIGSVRILCILYYCGSQPQQMTLDLDPQGQPPYTHLIDSETKLQKLDFWLRYPDHLAAALLRGCEDRSLLSYQDEIKQIIRAIFADEEPDLRGTEMMRYFYGAYDSLDDIMRFLLSRWLVYRRSLPREPRTQYYLTTKGCDVVRRLLLDIPEMQWYADRCTLITTYFGHLAGLDLRKRQYLERAYALARHKAPIPRVDDEVRSRFVRHFGEAL